MGDRCVPQYAGGGPRVVPLTGPMAPMRRAFGARGPLPQSETQSMRVPLEYRAATRWQSLASTPHAPESRS